MRSQALGRVAHKKVRRWVNLSGTPILTYTVASPKLDDEALSWFVDNEATKAVLAVRGVGGVSRVVKLVERHGLALLLGGSAALMMLVTPHPSQYAPWPSGIRQRRCRHRWRSACSPYCWPSPSCRSRPASASST